MNVLDVDFTSLAHGVASSGYPVLFALILAASAGAPLPVGILLAGLGAASAQRGGPDFAVLVASGIVASVVGDGVDFGIGRAGGRRMIRWAQARLQNSRMFGSAARYRGTPEIGRTPAGRLALRNARSPLSVRHMAAGRGPRDGGRGTVPRLEAVIFLSRFAVTALATPASLVAGAAGMTAGAFLFWDAAGEAVFVVGNLTFGRFLSASGLSSGPLVLLLGALAVVSYIGIWMLGRGGHDEQKRRAGTPSRQAQVAVATAPSSRRHMPKAKRPAGVPLGAMPAPHVVASRRIVCDVLSVTRRAVCGTG